MTPTEAEVWQIARDVCTPRELEALDYRYRRDLSVRAISLALGLSTSSVRDRLANAQRKIQLELERRAA